jgi:hypothetical protein
LREVAIFRSATSRSSLPTTRSLLALFVAGLVLVGLVVQLAPAQAATGINQKLNFQGRLLGAAGAVVADGNYNLEFRVYVGGTGCVSGGSSPCSGTEVWRESWVYGINSPDNRVAVRNGYFSVQLGSICPVAGGTCTSNTGNSQTNTGIDFNDDTLWLSINVGNTSTAATFAGASGDGEMLPFRRLTAAAYALNANRLGGLTSSQFVQLAQGVQTASTSSNPAIGINATSGSGNMLTLQSSGVDVFDVTSAGDVNLGQNADKTLNVLARSTNAAGRKLTIQAGAGGAGATGVAGGNLVLQGGNAAGTSGNANGGDVQIYGGTAVNSGTAGNVALAYNGSSAVGNVGIRKAASASFALDVSGTVNTSGTLSFTGVATDIISGGTDEDVTIAPNGTGRLVVGGTTPTVNSASSLTVSTSSNGALNLSPNGSGDVVIQQAAGSQVQITAVTAASTVDQLAITNSGFASATNGVDGISVTFGSSNASGDALHVVPSYAGGGTDALTFNALEVDAFSPTNAAGTDTVNGLKLGNLTDPGATITSNALNVGTGWDNVLNVGGTPIINSTGVVQSAGISGSYTGITGVGTIGTGTWQGTAVAAIYGGTGQTTYAVGDLLTGDTSNTLSKIAAVAIGSCLISQGIATKPIWGSCGAGATDLQGAYTASANPAVVNLNTSGKDIQWNLTDQGTDPNFLVNLQCTTSCSTNGRFAIQTAATDVFTVSPNSGNITAAPAGAGDIMNTLDSDSNLQVASTFTGTGPSIAVVDVTLTHNGTAAGTSYALSVTNADNGANAGVPAAIGYFRNANAAETVTDGLLVEQTGAGILSNGLEIKRTAGTLSTGLLFTGAIGTEIKLQSAESIANTSNGTIALASDAGALTLSLANAATSATISNSNGNIILDSASNTIALAASETQLQRTGATGYNIDLADAGTTKLSLINSGGGNGVLSAKTGFQINGGNADAGTYLRGDGTNYISGSIAFGDIPTCGGTCNYIGNQTTQQSAATFNILSGAAGNTGGQIQAAASATAPVFVLRGGATPGVGGDLLRLQDSTGANLAKVYATGDEDHLGYLASPYGGMGAYSNLLTYSDQFDNAAWSKASVSAPTADNQTAPDGTTTAESLATSGSGGSVCQFTATSAASTTFTFSVWLKTATTQNVDLRIDGGATSCGTAATVTGTAVTVGATATWQRFSVTQAIGACGGCFAKPFIYPGTTGGSGTVQAWGAQLVTGSVPGPYLRTNTTTTTTVGRGLVSNGPLQIRDIDTSGGTGLLVARNTNNGLSGMQVLSLSSAGTLSLTADHGPLSANGATALSVGGGASTGTSHV